MALLSYEEFLEEAKSRFMDYISEEYKEAEFMVERVKKNGRTRDGICIRPKSSNISPVLYVDEMYEEYRVLKDVDTAFHVAAAQYSGMLDDVEKEGARMKAMMENVKKENLFFHLVKKKGNEEFLSGIPHRDFLDMAVIYKVLVEKTDEVLSCGTVTWHLAESFDMDEEELYRTAYENTRKLFDFGPETVFSRMKEAFDMNSYMADFLKNEITEDKLMYFLGNYESACAAPILYNDMLKDIAGRVDDDLCLIPIHENNFAVVSKTAFKEGEDIREVIRADREANPVTDSVYEYDRKKDEVRVFMKGEI